MKHVREWLPSIAIDIVGIIGSGLIVYGIGRVYEPLGYIVSGGLLIVAAYLMARGA